MKFIHCAAPYAPNRRPERGNVSASGLHCRAAHGSSAPRPIDRDLRGRRRSPSATFVRIAKPARGLCHVCGCPSLKARRRRRLSGHVERIQIPMMLRRAAMTKAAVLACPRDAYLRAGAPAMSMTKSSTCGPITMWPADCSFLFDAISASWMCVLNALPSRSCDAEDKAVEPRFGAVR